MIHAVDNSWKDLRFALRQLGKRPGFTITAVAVLALGLGANAGIFSVVNAVLLEPLPFANPQKLMAIFERDVLPNDPYNSVAPANYLDWRRDTTSFAQIAASSKLSFNLSSKSDTFTPQRVFGSAVSANLFQTLGVVPVLGREFRSQEDRQNAPYVAVISYGLWKQRFAGSPDAIHRQIRLDGSEYSIVGVMPEGFHYPTRNTQVWVALNRNLTAEQLHSHDDHGLLVVGRLLPDRTLEQGRAEIDSFVKRYHKDHPAEMMGKGATVIRLDQYLVRDVRTSLLVLLGAVGCLLVIACVNIANLLLTRALGRQREMAIRAAVGATRGQIVRQLLIESCVISLAGAFVGLVLAAWGAPVLAAHVPGADQLPQTAHIQVNYTVLLFTIALAFVTGILAGLFPAFSASQVDLVNNLKEGGRSNTSGRSQAGTRSTLIAVEVAISATLLIAAGLLIRSFAQLQQVHTGFRAENTITMGIALPDATYKNRAAVASFDRQLTARLQSLPALEASGLVSFPPLAGDMNDSVYHIQGHPLPPSQMMDLEKRDVDPGYFRAAGIPLLKGRVFTPEDDRGYEDKRPRIDPVLISESTAKKFFGSLNPLGQRIAYGSDAGTSGDDPIQAAIVYQVIGIVGDILPSPDQPAEPELYRPLYDGDSRDIYIVAHTAGDPRAVISSLRGLIHRLNPDLPVHDVRTIQQIAAESTAGREFSLILLSLFAGLALVLASIGLYGVVSYAVSQRTNEIGIRMALGATGLGISRAILLQGMRPALAGIVTGLICAAFLTRTLQTMLFGVGAGDPVTFLAVPFVLLFVVALACTIPAYRASRIDPMTALRTE